MDAPGIEPTPPQNRPLRPSREFLTYSGTSAPNAMRLDRVSSTLDHFRCGPHVVPVGKLGRMASGAAPWAEDALRPIVASVVIHGRHECSQSVESVDHLLTMEVSERHARTRAIMRDTLSPANRPVRTGGDASRHVARVVSDVSVLCPRRVV